MSHRWNTSPPDSLIMVRKKDGNLVMVESMDQLRKYYLSHRDEFDDFPEPNIGRFNRDEKGRTCWKFDGFNFYHDSVK